ncbi:hypothetical protein B0H21DRAFT_708269 [Amylocystis lapponica]|nr:hypothetical protein B0H21DRAFT_708269 [Amylocystis lapponica]
MSIETSEHNEDFCKALQREEWEVLESIYPDFVSGDITVGIVKLEISIEFPGPRLVEVIDDHTISSSSKDLTPTSPHKLLEMWQEGEDCYRLPHPAPYLLLPLLVAHDESTQLAKFSETSYACEICLTSIKGARCILLSCSHVFCRCCLEDFWKLCITEGDVGRVGCPDPRCVKDGREANEEEVRRVVTEEEVRRWKWLREKRAIEKDPFIIHCPMSFCQRPIPKPQNIEEGSGWERLRTCPGCEYSFCAYCKCTWHGSTVDCPISATESYFLEYMALAEGSPERDAMEQRFGRENMRKLVAKFEEEQANKSWLQWFTTACPKCQVHVEKNLGCNHMTCKRCGENFCYRCGDRLRPGHAFDHFSTPGERCYSKLYDFQTVDDEWQPVI